MISPLVLVVLALLTPYAARAGCDVRARAQVGMDVIDRSLLVRLAVNNTEGIFVVDTGAERSMVTPPAVRRLGLTADDWVATNMVGVSGGEVHRNVDPFRLTLGGVALHRANLARDNTLAVATIANTRRGQYTVDGLLGRDILATFDLDIDVPRQQLTLYDVKGCSGRFLPWNVPYDAVPLQRSPWRTTVSPLVLMLRLDNVRLRAMLDTGAANSLLFARGAAQLSLTPQSLAADPPVTLSGISPTATIARLHRFDRLTVGDAATPSPSILVDPVPTGSNIDMLLGFDWVQAHRLWLSFATQQIFRTR